MGEAPLPPRMDPGHFVLAAGAASCLLVYGVVVPVAVWFAVSRGLLGGAP